MSEVSNMAEHWIIPCSVKVYDIIEHFKKQNLVVWKNSFTIRKGDIAYIYIGSPHSEIKFKCEVVSDSVDEKLLSENEYAIPAKKSNNYFSKKEKYIQMKLITEYPNGTFKLEDLREHGLGQVQIQARTDSRLQQYINEKESEIFDKEEVTTNA